MFGVSRETRLFPPTELCCLGGRLRCSRFLIPEASLHYFSLVHAQRPRVRKFSVFSLPEAPLLLRLLVMRLVPSLARVSHIVHISCYLSFYFFSLVSAFFSGPESDV